MEFEDVLQEVGEYGRYQRDLIAYFLVPAATALPWFTLSVFFMVSAPQHWCRPPAEVAASNLSAAEQRALVSPAAGDASCLMHDINYTRWLDEGWPGPPANDTPTRPCDRGWVYDDADYQATAATQWDLVCKDGHYRSFIFTMYNVGSIIGAPIYGALSDRFGRKPIFFVVVGVTAASAFASVLVSSFTAFVLLKSINGALMPSIFQLPYIIVLEIVSPSMRTRMNGITNLAWSIGSCILPAIAYFIRHWVNLGLSTSSVILLYFLYWRFLPESPRWLLSQGRIDEAVLILAKIGERNDRLKDPKILTHKMQILNDRIKKEKETEGVKNSTFDVLRYPRLRKYFLIITYCWIANLSAYYGLQLNVPYLDGNEFLNFFLLSLVEIPGFLSGCLFMAYVGRRWCPVTGFLLIGSACVVPAFLPDDIKYVGVISSMIGKFCSAGTFLATYQQCSEIYPTTIRASAMGTSSTIAVFFSLAVPYLVYLSEYGKYIPFVVIGSICFLASFLATFLPETRNSNLPQTVNEVEHFGTGQKFFSFNRRKRSSFVDHDIVALGEMQKAAENGEHTNHCSS